MTNTYVVAGSRPWNKASFDRNVPGMDGRWLFISDAQELTSEFLRALRPRYVFFLHWSALVPPEMTREFECVCFHMTDVPFGRGGSPLQNLIVRGIRETKLTALRMVERFDEGPVYFKEPLSLEGSAQEIYERASELSFAIIRRIVADNPEPVPQVGEPTVFARRKPEQSRIGKPRTLEQLYDHIRMLDADGYPRAFLDADDLRLEFRNARRDGENLVAEVTFRLREGTR